MGKKVLVVGGGGREHALVVSLLKGGSTETVICTPGNAGTAGVSGCRNIHTESLAEIAALAAAENVDLVIPGPEGPLAEGLVDRLSAAGIASFGPNAAAARLESSKSFAKDFMARYGVATADYEHCTSAKEALRALNRFSFPVVIKADGLASGKGVLICSNREEAEAAVSRIMVEREFGAAGKQLVIEECLVGWETSIIGLCDGETFMSFLPAKDHKRADDGDLGPNTGGMGVIAPHPLVDAAVAEDIQNHIINPTLMGLKAHKLAYKGFLFIGIMVTPDGAKTLEYNVRLGDPEAQALLPLLDGDLLEYIDLAMAGRLIEAQPRWRAGASCCVVLASQGYPGAYPVGRTVAGIHEAEREGAEVYLAGVDYASDADMADSGIHPDGPEGLVSTGGRVLGVTAVDHTPGQARSKAYSAISRITLKGGWYRKDIGGT